jgi:long-chain acyl-CoA synthetase
VQATSIALGRRLCKEQSQDWPRKEAFIMGVKFENLVQLCERSCREFKDRQLFGVKEGGAWTWLTYREFGEMVDAFRGGLAHHGVGRGDVVAIVANNRVEWAVACYATYGLGAAFVPMYQEQLDKEWQFILGDCKAKVVIGANDAVTGKLRAMQAELPALQHVIGLELPESDHLSYAALLAAGRQHPVPAMSPSSDYVAGLIYTSGTTGMPKGVILSHGNICSNVNAIHQVFEFQPDDRSLAFLPWAHSFGQTCELHCLVSMGCSLAINDDIKNLVPNLAEVKPTVLYAVPRVFNRLYDGVNAQIAAKPGIIQWLFKRGVEIATRKANGESVGAVDQLLLSLADRLIFSTVRARFGGRLKYAISGSAALSPEVAAFIDALGITVYEGYGLTETSPIATANYPGARKVGTVGKAIPGVSIQIDRSVTGDPQHGEIIIKGPNVMKGYHNRPDENAAVMMEDRSFRSGDMGFVDPEGFLHITGRIKEQYKLENGKYVVPSPIEEKLKLSPYIANVMIYGANKPHNVALVIPDLDALRAWAAKQHVALDDVPKSDKVHELLETEITGLSRDIKGYERVQDFVVAVEDFTTDNGMLTPTLKLKRRAVLERYGKDLDALY